MGTSGGVGEIMARESGTRGAAAAAFCWSWVVAVWVIMAAVASASSWDVGGGSGGSDGGDDSDCGNSWEMIEECIPYASGQVASPSPGCCKATLTVHRRHPICLCMALRSSADTSFQLPMDPSLVLKVPTICKIDGIAVTNCPRLLSLSPNSPDMQFFNRINATATATAKADQPRKLSPSANAGRRSPEGPSWGRVAALAVSVALGADLRW